MQNYNNTIMKFYADKFLKGFIITIGKPLNLNLNLTLPLYLPLTLNEDDFYTGKPIRLIPAVFRFTLVSGKDFLTSDIRSLYDFSNYELVNPYNYSPISQDCQKRYIRQLKWLSKFKFPISHTGVVVCETDQLIINTFSLLSKYQYVSYLSFLSMDFLQLKETYLLLHFIIENLESHRTSKLFKNWKWVKLYTKDMKEILKRELILNIRDFISDNPSFNCLHVMLALKPLNV